MNTAELPVLRETAECEPPHVPSFAVTRTRGHALANMGAEGYRYTFLCYDVVVSRSAIWIAQTDWLPENPGDYDYVAAEWPRIVELARQWGYHDLGEPLYDTLLGVWCWAVPAILLNSSPDKPLACGPPGALSCRFAERVMQVSIIDV